MAGFVDQRVFIDPADAGGIGPQGRRHASRQAAGDVVQVLENPRAGPVKVRTVLEDDVHEGQTKKGKTAHDFCIRHREHGRGQRVGHLVLDHLRRLSRKFSEHDDLHVGQVRDRIEWRRADCPDADSRQDQRRDDDQQAVLQ